MKKEYISDKIIEKIKSSPIDIQLEAQALISNHKNRSLKNQPEILMDLAKLLNLKVEWDDHEYRLEE